MYIELITNNFSYTFQNKKTYAIHHSLSNMGHRQKKPQCKTIKGQTDMLQIVMSKEFVVTYSSSCTVFFLTHSFCICHVNSIGWHSKAKRDACLQLVQHHVAHLLYYILSNTNINHHSHSHIVRMGVLMFLFVNKCF